MKYDYTKNVNTNVEWTWFPNLQAWNNSRRVDMRLKPINRLINRSKCNNLSRLRRFFIHILNIQHLLKENNRKKKRFRFVRGDFRLTKYSNSSILTFVRKYFNLRNNTMVRSVAEEERMYEWIFPIINSCQSLKHSVAVEGVWGRWKEKKREEQNRRTFCSNRYH